MFRIKAQNDTLGITGHYVVTFGRSARYILTQSEYGSEFTLADAHDVIAYLSQKYPQTTWILEPVATNMRHMPLLEDANELVKHRLMPPADQDPNLFMGE